jgi:hypothetical protein
MIPSRTHRTTVAAETSSSFATCFVVMYLFVMFVMLNLSAIYTRHDFDAPGAACELVARRSGMGGWQDVSTLVSCFQIVSISSTRLSGVIPTVSKDVSNVSIFVEDF